MPAVYSDDFTGSLDAQLKVRTSPVAWTYYGNSSGNFANWARINASNQLKGTTGGTTSAFLTGNVGSPDMYAQAAVYAANGQACPVVVRAVDSQNYIGLQHYTSTQLRLVIANNAAAVSLAVTLSNGATSGGTGVMVLPTGAQGANGAVLRLEAEGTTIRVYKGGVLYGTATGVTSLATNQKAGMAAIASLASTYDPWIDSFEAGTLYAVAESLGVTELTSNRVYQRQKGTNAASISIGGTYSSSTISTIEYQVVDYDDATVRQAWATLPGLTIGSGAWSGVASVPIATNGKSHRIQLRSKNAGGTVLASTATGTRWTVGATLIGLGQSNMDSLFNTSGAAVEAFAGANAYMDAAGNWSQPSTMKGAGALANLLSSLVDMPVGVMEAAEANKDIRQLAPAHTSNSVSISAGAYWQPVLDVLSRAGNDVEAALWTQGETAYSGQTYQGYYDALAAIISGLKTATGRTGAGEFRFGISLIGQDLSVTPTDANNLIWQTTQQAQHDIALNVAGAYVSHSAYDLPMAAGEPHYLSPDGYAEHGRRFARSYAYQLGAGYPARGLEIDSTRVGGLGTKVLVGLKPNGLSALENSTAFTGFEYRDPATTNWITTTAAREDSWSVSLTVPAGTTTIRYAYGRQPDATNVARSLTRASGSSTLGLPIMTPREPTFTVYPMTLIDITAASAAPTPQGLGVVEATVIAVGPADASPAAQPVTVVSADAIEITPADAAPIPQLIAVSEGFNVAVSAAVATPVAQAVGAIEATSIVVTPAVATPVAQSVSIVSASGLIAPSNLVLVEGETGFETSWTDNSTGEDGYEWLAVVQYYDAGDPGPNPLQWTADGAKGRVVRSPGGLLPANTTAWTLPANQAPPGAEIYVAVRSRLGALGSDWVIESARVYYGLPQTPGDFVVTTVPGGMIVEFAQYPVGGVLNYTDESYFFLEVALTPDFGSDESQTTVIGMNGVPGFAQGLVGSLAIDALDRGLPLNRLLYMRMAAELDGLGRSPWSSTFTGTAGVIPTTINVAAAVVPPLPQDVFISVGFHVFISPADAAPRPSALNTIFEPLTYASLVTPTNRSGAPAAEVRNAAAT